MTDKFLATFRIDQEEWKDFMAQAKAEGKSAWVIKSKLWKVAHASVDEYGHTALVTPPMHPTRSWEQCVSQATMK